jgi:hypothetical protein
MSISTKKECIAICKEMAKGLNGKWKNQPSGPHQGKWIPFISNGEVYILKNHDNSYSAAYEGVNYELESWDGRTPKEALSKLVKAFGNSIQHMIYRRDELNSDIPKAELRYEEMKTWTK